MHANNAAFMHRKDIVTDCPTIGTRPQGLSRQVKRGSEGCSPASIAKQVLPLRLILGRATCYVDI